jgi:hydrogenase/urease accessory protein HupE
MLKGTAATESALRTGSDPKPFIRRAVLAMIAIFGPATTAMAHDPGLSALEVRIDRDKVVAQVSFARSDAKNLLKEDYAEDPQGTAKDDNARRTRLEAIATRSLSLEIDDRVLVPDSVHAEPDSSGGFGIRIAYPRRAGSTLTIGSSFFQELPRGHRQYISVRGANGSIIAEQILDGNLQRIELRVGDDETLASLFRQFVGLGLEHILTGYDHLAFLLALLITGPAIRSAAKIITSFTVAHSITLGTATLGVARISPAIVEPMIAASIVYVGVENLYRRNLNLRWMLTFAFGLVHGFGFASALRELGIVSRSGAAVPLLSFNLGVELGQTTIAAIVLPAVWRLQKKELFSARLVPVLSLLVAAAGSVWFVERLV